jgi:4'-phosphopantetheinyl transferase
VKPVRGTPQVRVLWADARTTDDAAIEALVADEDRERLAALVTPRRRREYLVGRALLRCALERHTGRPARSHRLATTPTGKPICVGGPALGLSHDGGLVVCAISNAGEIGIDVQSPSRRRHETEIADRYFSAAERAWLERARSAGAFYWLWVLKEAYLKRLGTGLAGGLRQLECRIEPPLIDAAAPTRTALALYSLGNAFVGVAAGAGEIDYVECERWTGEVVDASRLEPIAFGTTGASSRIEAQDREAS